MVDMLDDYCTMRGFPFLRLTGSTNRVQRMVNLQVRHPVYEGTVDLWACLQGHWCFSWVLSPLPPKRERGTICMAVSVSGFRT